MAWYRTGTVSVTNGSAAVVGAGTDFIANAEIGHAFLGPDGRVYEVEQVVSATQIALAGAYLGGSGGGQGYAVMPTSSFMRDLALGAAELLNSFGEVRDGVGKGLFPDGLPVAPGIRFAADQDTGLRRVNTNALALVTGGVDRVVADSVGRVGIGGAPGHFFDVLAPAGPYVARMFNTSAAADQFSVVLFGQGEGGAATGCVGTGGSGVANPAFRGTFVVGTQNARPLVFTTADTERARFDHAGNLLVGSDAGSSHRLAKADDAATGSAIAAIGFRSIGDVMTVYASKGPIASAAASAIRVNSNENTGRSINAGGTINASGADYAEYMLKADGCGTISPGDVCGVDIDGRLTRTWGDAVSFVVKSTDPAYVGGDVWSSTVGPEPAEPGLEPVAPIAPPPTPASDEEGDFAAWHAATVAYQAEREAYAPRAAAWIEAVKLYVAAKSAWDADLEIARQKVDRIAFCGQVPVNVGGSFAVGDYLIAAAAGAGIKAVAVPAGEITFDQYRRRIGKIWAVRDGRAWVDVQHG